MRGFHNQLLHLLRPWAYLGSLMDDSRSHIFATWFSRSIKYMSPETSVTIPIPLGVWTLSLSLGLQTSTGRFAVVCGKAPTCLMGLRKELKPPLGGFVIIAQLSSWPLIWPRMAVEMTILSNGKQDSSSYLKPSGSPGRPRQNRFPGNTASILMTFSPQRAELSTEVV